MDRDRDKLIYLALKRYLLERDLEVSLSEDLPFKDEMTNLSYFT
jgi:hypothetical protein